MENIQNVLCKDQKQLFADVIQNRYSEEFYKFYKKTRLLESLFIKDVVFQNTGLIKKSSLISLNFIGSCTFRLTDMLGKQGIN